MNAKQTKITSTTPEPIININHFKMNFGNKTVIKDLSFDVYKGEVFGFLGSNGSGKTTTIRALLGIYKPTSGILNIGNKPFSIPSDIKLGYLPEERGFYRKETVIDVMTYFGQLKGLQKAEAKDRAETYLRRVKLIDMASVKIDKLSGGQQQKIQLGITIIDDPELLILDEPTKGFDPVNRRLLMDIIQEHNKAGATIMFITHQMEEVEQLCDRIILLKDGVARAYGTVKDVKREFNNLSLDDIFIKVYGDENEEIERNNNV
ncbi:MAG: type transport system ATP-binding protein [Patescibacteria group bacterium]|nr:type transport system ATP-binding protein [Patescibacteria group bacterium]